MHISRCETEEDFRHAVALVEKYVGWLNLDLSFQDYASELENFRTLYSPPSGAFLLAYHDHKPVGCIGLRSLHSDTGEVKRLYVLDEYRGQGAGSQLIEKIIPEARELGYATLMLDTLPNMKAAARLYQRFGFTDTKAYRFNPVTGTRYMQLVL